MAEHQQGGQQSKKGGAKAGRNRVECERYRAQGRREQNKAQKLRKHIRRFPNDEAAKRVQVGGRVVGGR